MKAYIEMFIGGILHDKVLVNLDPSIGKTTFNALGPEYQAGHERRIISPADDPKWIHILELCKRYAPKREKWDDPGYAWAKIEFKYTKKELEASPWLRLEFAIPQGIINQRKYEYGTVFNEDCVCDQCGFGLIQESDLVIRVKKGRKSDIMRTLDIGTTWIISARLFKLMKDNNITGFETRPVRVGTPKSPVSQDWYQLIITGDAGFASEETRFGRDPFHLVPPDEYVCETHHAKERQIQSELYLENRSLLKTDIAVTRTLSFGTEHIYGYYESPFPLIVISQRLYKLMVENKIKGFKAEVVRFPDSDIQP